MGGDMPLLTERAFVTGDLLTSVFQSVMNLHVLRCLPSFERPFGSAHGFQMLRRDLSFRFFQSFLSKSGCDLRVTIQAVTTPPWAPTVAYCRLGSEVFVVELFSFAASDTNTFDGDGGPAAGHQP